MTTDHLRDSLTASRDRDRTDIHSGTRPTQSPGSAGVDRSATTPGVLHVREHGEGTPILLLHGLGLSGRAFALMEPLLGETCRLIIPDLRGHGQSKHLPTPHTTDAMAENLVPILDALGIDTIHVLGHSHGGAVAQVFARANPERVRSLVLVSTYPVQLLTWWQRMLGVPAPLAVKLFGTQPSARMVRWLRSAGGGRRLSAKAAEICAAIVSANDRQHLADALHWARQFDSREWLRTLQVPTAVIHGEEDCIVVPEQARLLADGIPGARLHFVERAGHALPLSHPAELSGHIVAWLEAHEALAAGGKRNVA